MTDVFLERNFDLPVTAAGVHATVRTDAWCFQAHRVAWQRSFLQVGGRRMVCWFSAPDAESTRIVLRTLGADLTHLWIGTVHEPQQEVAPNVLVERSFAEPVTFAQIQALEDAGAWCLETRRVKFARSFFSADRKRMICLYEAPDAEEVRCAQREAGVPFDAAWSFELILPEPAP